MRRRVLLEVLSKRLGRMGALLIRRWAYVLVMVPFVAEWLGKTNPPLGVLSIAKTGILGLLIGVCIRLLYKESDKLQHLAQTDELTGLFNRRRFNEDIEGEIIRAKRLQVPLTLLYFDVDNFKNINDTYGHVQGDLILVEAARFLERSVRRYLDRSYRIGGDEFAVLMPGAHVKEAVEAIARHRSEYTHHSVLDSCDVCFSVGAVEMNGDSPVELLQKADRYMYAAKRGENIENNERACYVKI